MQRIYCSNILRHIFADTLEGHKFITSSFKRRSQILYIYAKYVRREIIDQKKKNIKR